MLINSSENNIDSPQSQKNADIKDQDRRYFPRWKVKNLVRYHKENESAYHECFSEDISLTGARICTKDEILPQEKLFLKIFLSGDSAPIDAHGRVVWQKANDQENLVGIRFEWLEGNARDQIFNYAFEFNKEQVVRNWFKGF